MVDPCPLDADPSTPWMQTPVDADPSPWIQPPGHVTCDACWEANHLDACHVTSDACWEVPLPYEQTITCENALVI